MTSSPKRALEKRALEKRALELFLLYAVWGYSIRLILPTYSALCGFESYASTRTYTIKRQSLSLNNTAKLARLQKRGDHGHNNHAIVYSNHCRLRLEHIAFRIQSPTPLEAEAL
jgi:hypothetical protein